MVLLLMCIHLAAAAIIAAGWMTGVFHFPLSMLPTLFLLPLWGPLCALATELHIRGGERADEEAGMGRFGITDEIYRNIRMVESDAGDILPIEDVLCAGTPVQRRKLLLSVLHSGPEPFVRPLRLAGVNDDTEVVHYAVTALVELRGSYAQKLLAMDTKLKEQPYDLSVMLASASLDEEYLKSGIPEKAEKERRAAHCKETLEKLLNALSWQDNRERTADPGTFSIETASKTGLKTASEKASFPERSELLRRLGKICLLLNDSKGAEKAGRLLIREYPDQEEGFLLLLRAYAAAGDGKGVAETAGMIRQSGMYLSPAAREELEFWEPGSAAGVGRGFDAGKQQGNK